MVLPRGYIEVIWGYIGIMEKNMEALRVKLLAQVLEVWTCYALLFARVHLLRWKATLLLCFRV